MVKYMNKDQQREKYKKHYAANKDKINKRCQAYYAANKEKILQRRKELRAEKRKAHEESKGVSSSEKSTAATAVLIQESINESNSVINTESAILNSDVLFDQVQRQQQENLTSEECPLVDTNLNFKKTFRGLSNDNASTSTGQNQTNGTSNNLMAHTYFMIPEITNKTRNWTSRITITEQIAPITCGSHSKLKRYIFTDGQGNQILITVYDPHIEQLNPILHLFQVYDITNAEVKFVSPQFRILDSPYCWNLKSSTMITPLPEIPPNLDHWLDSITPFSVIANNRNNNANTFDIMGIILAAENPSTVVSQDKIKPIQHFTFVDTEGIPISLTLWEELVETVGPVLMEAAQSLSVVVAKRLSVSTFKGIALSSKKNSSFTIDPPFDAAVNLKAWIASKSNEELQELLIDRTITIGRDLIQKGALKTYTLRELNTIQKPGDYWIRGMLQLSDEEQKLFYFVCNHCSSKISADYEGASFDCRSCHKPATAMARAYLIMSVADQTGIVKVLAMDDIAERILQTTATKIAGLLQLGQSYDLNIIRAELNGKVFQISLRRTSANVNDTHKKMMLRDYYQYDCSTGQSSTIIEEMSPCQTSDKAKEIESSHSPLSPLKRQMSGINLSSGSTNKKLYMVSDEGNLITHATKEHDTGGSNSDLYALDFDGVICDSCGESSISALKAAKVRWPTLFDNVDSSLEGWIVDQMHTVRPVVETGYENVLLVRLLLEMRIPSVCSSSVAEGLSVEGLLENWFKIKPVLMEEWNEDKDFLIDLFGKIRDEWMDNDLTTWIGANRLYPGVSDALKFASAKLYIVTTKQSRFAEALLRELAGVTIPPERMYGLGTGPKVEVLKQLQNMPEHNGLTLHFVEDRLATLKNVIKEPELDRWNLYLGDWGYNTQKEREDAAGISRIKIIQLSDFSNKLK